MCIKHVLCCTEAVLKAWLNNTMSSYHNNGSFFVISDNDDMYEMAAITWY